MRIAGQLIKCHVLLISLLGLVCSCHIIALPRDFPYGKKLTFVSAETGDNYHLTFTAPAVSDEAIVSFQWSVNDKAAVYTDQISLEHLPVRIGNTPDYTEHTYATLALIAALLTIANHSAETKPVEALEGAFDNSFMSAKNFLQKGAIKLSSSDDDEVKLFFLDEDENSETAKKAQSSTPKIMMGEVIELRKTSEEKEQQLKHSNFPIINLSALTVPGCGRNPRYELVVLITLKNGRKREFHKLTLIVDSQLTYLYKLIKKQLWFRDDSDDDNPPPSASRKKRSSNSFWSSLNCYGSGQQDSDSKDGTDNPSENTPLVNSLIRFQIKQGLNAGKMY